MWCLLFFSQVHIIIIIVIFQMLRQPDSVISNDFKQHRIAAADTTIIAEYEDLVIDWMNTIENVLMDSSDER